MNNSYMPKIRVFYNLRPVNAKNKSSYYTFGLFLGANNVLINKVIYKYNNKKCLLLSMVIITNKFEYV